MAQDVSVGAPAPEPAPAPTPHALVARLLRDRERAACFALVAFAVLFNAVFLLPELTSRPPDLNDNVFHYLNLQRADEAIRELDDPTDPWLSQIAEGFPVFHYYQHLPYVLPAAVHTVTRLPLEGLFHALNYLLLCLFPVSIYWSMRYFGFDRPEAGLGALSSSLLSTDGLFGFDLNSYVWSGYGLYTQLWGMLLLPPALALSYRVIREGKRYFWAVVFLAATVLSHLAFGYVAFASIALFSVLSLSRGELRSRAPRALALVALTVAVTSYFLVPLALDSDFLNRSVWDPRYKYDSFGAQQILEWLVRGELFDHRRLPVLTVLLALGLTTCALRRHEERYRLAAVLFLAWLLLYFGPKTWGGLLDGAPLGRDFYFHRLIAGVHLAGIFLIGIGLAAPWRWVRSLQDRRAFLVYASVIAVALIPAYFERGDYLRDNRTYMRQTSAAFASEQQDIDGLLAVLKAAPPGRVYAGLPARWGRGYRVGAVPVHAILTANGIDNVGLLWHPWSMPGDIHVTFDERRPEDWDLFNIRYVVAPEGQTFPDFVHFVGSFGRHSLYRVDTTGYFDVVRSDRAFPASKSSFYATASTWFSSGAPALRQHPSLVFAGQEPPGGSEAGVPLTAEQYPRYVPGAPRPVFGSVLAEAVEANRYDAVVQLPQTGTVLLKQTFHPGWRAYVDGREAPTRMLVPGYLGVEVAEGTHAVSFRYGASTSRHVLQLLGVLVLGSFAIGASTRQRTVVALSNFRRRARL